MEPWKFDKLVEARANARVQEKIRKCKLQIFNAVMEVFGHNLVRSLDGNGWNYYSSTLGNYKKVLEIMLSDNWSKGWPGELWDREKQIVAEEILGMMQPMERALRDLERVPEADESQPESQPEIQEQTAPT